MIVGLVMVGGWPIAHHVWAGNRVDSGTVQEVIADLRQRFAFQRIVFVGDRGMVTQENLDEFVQEGHGYLVGVKRRRQDRRGGGTDLAGASRLSLLHLAVARSRL